MYTEHFGFTHPPFRPPGGEDEWFPAPQHTGALDKLLQGIETGAPFMLLCGPTGTGKHTLLDILARRLAPEIRIAHTEGAELGYGELLGNILNACQLPCPRESEVMRYRRLLDFVERQRVRRRRVLLIITGAHRLSTDNLEQLRLLSGVNGNEAHLMNILLAGEDSLLDTLEQPALRALAVQITTRARLWPFNAADTRAYIRFRMKQAGASGELFSEHASDLIHEASSGIPSAIDYLCTAALHQAAQEDSQRIGASQIARICRVLEQTGGQTADATALPKAADSPDGTSLAPDPPGIELSADDLEMARRLAAQARAARQRSQRIRRLLTGTAGILLAGGLIAGAIYLADGREAHARTAAHTTQNVTFPD
ncbi:MAG TPA: hypothetical protein ENJ79_11045 [Gammaproteobacteria bacterium]|nr:hypothetical protein [Gammaproteobacteria bacterium]